MTTTQPSYTALLKKTTSAFWIFLFLHTLFWTLGPFIARSSLPHDTLESISWGSQWQWGYNKHPFLTAWINAAVVKLFQSTDWPSYLLAQLAVTTTFIASWRLARNFLSPIGALVAVMALDGVLFYNINSFNFTPDTLQSPLWALLSLFFYRALTTEKIFYWLMTGLFAALCLMTKYQVLLLLLPMFLLCLVDTQARTCFSKPGVYLALAFSILLLSPHLIWLWQSEWISLRYAFGVSTQYTSTSSHLRQPLVFLFNSLIYTGALFLLLWPFYPSPKNGLSLSTFQWRFLFFIGLGPFCLTLFLCILSGDHYPVRWLTPYFFLLSTLVLAQLKPRLTALQLNRFLISLLIFSSLLWAARIGTTVFFPRENSDAFLPNRQIAYKLSALWQQHYATKLPYLVGSHYLVASIQPYLPEQAIPVMGWDKEESPWLSEDDLLKKGGLFIWDLGKNYTWDASSAAETLLPEEIKRRYPQLIILEPYTFYRNTVKQTPVRIGVALLPPQAEKNKE